MKVRWNRLLAGRTRKWIAAAVVLVVVAAVALAAVSSGGGSGAAVRTENVTVTVPGGPGVTGTVSIDATLYLPAATGKLPAVLMAHGFGGSKASIAGDARDLAGHGFVVLAYSARGFGASTGQIGLDSLDYEIPDARALVSYLATRPEVLLDKPGDPRVGVTGASYGGALSLMLAGTDPRIDAVAPVITWNDLSASLFPNALDTGGASAGTPAQAVAAGDGVFKKSWAANLIASVISGASLTGTATTAQADSGDSGFGRSTRSSTATVAPTTAAAGDPASGTSVPSNGAAGSGAPGAAAPSSAAASSAAASSGAPGSASATSSATGGATTSAGCGRLMLAICAAYSQAAQTGREPAALTALLARSSPKSVAGKITAPTLLVQGEQDTLFGLDQSDANARQIAANGTTVALTWYNGGHDGGSPDQVTRNRITGWFTHYLAGTGAAPSTAFTYSLDGPLSETGRARTRTLQASAYPGVSGAGVATFASLPLTGRPQLVLNPPGGAPAGISSLPGLSGLLGTALANFAGGLPGQTARFSTAPMSALTVITGTPRVSVRVAGIPLGAATTGTADPGAVLFASISKVTAGGTRTLAGNAVAPVRITGLPANGSPTTVTIDLPAVALQVEAGSTLEVALSTTDQAYAGPTVPAAYQIALTGAAGTGTLLVPEVDGVRVSASDIPVGTLIALIVLAVLAVVALVLMGRVRRSKPVAGAVPDSDIDLVAAPEVPLDIVGLGKSYPGGVTAVSDVTFRVETGQVLGLLGPNGAGKTTTLRMVMGLITPTAGEIRVFGQRIKPGADILARIGSFVEGSGFLPHLSGKANLDLYWRATGRPWADGHMDEALQIAGLGKAINRRVKTYSQGMRQRLAIAQAMLGLPDLLLLDEPTNGLDPPQIHAMREVLRRYAATGRTVLVSSHMLSEVEQTCSHVVVVHQGRTIAAGTVAEMVAASGDMVFTVDSEPRALAALRALPGIGEVELDDPDRSTGAGGQPGLVRADLGAVTAPQAVSALVAAGVAVTTAAPRNRLEDVFLDLVGAAGPSSPDGGSR